MSKQVLFNGVIMVRAGGATKVDASAFQSLGISGVGTVALIGEADGGLPNTVYNFTDPQQMANAFRSGPLADAASLVFRPMNDTRVPGGAQSVYVVKANQSTQSTATMPASSVNQYTLTSKDAGAHNNKITKQLTTVGGGKVIQFTFQDGSKAITETSPALGATPDFLIQYTGAGSAATMTISGTTLTTTVTGAVSDNLTLPFATYPTVNDLLNAIKLNPNYAITAVSGNPYSLASTALDWQSAVAIKSAAVPVTTKSYRIFTWINTNSTLVSAVAAGSFSGVVPDDDTAAVAFTGGARGISANSNWQAAFDLLGQVRANQTVPLISYDLTSQGFGSTATMASVLAASDAHAAFYSSTQGKNECENYVGVKGTKSAVIAMATTLQSPHTVFTSQRITRQDSQGNTVLFDEWAQAVILAGGRAGSVLGEPLTYKTLRCDAVTQDASWNPQNDGADMINAGIAFAFATPTKGIRFDRIITSYTKLDNAAYAEESIVVGWKLVSHDLRAGLEDTFTGTKGSPITVRAIYDATANLLEQFRQQGQIVDSILPDGTQLRAYRNIAVSLLGDQVSVSATISPVPGINFILNTLFLVPASIAA